MFLVMNQLHDVQKAYWHDNHKPIYFAFNLPNHVPNFTSNQNKQLSCWTQLEGGFTFIENYTNIYQC